MYKTEELSQIQSRTAAAKIPQELTKNEIETQVLSTRLLSVTLLTDLRDPNYPQRQQGAVWSSI